MNMMDKMYDYKGNELPIVNVELKSDFHLFSELGVGYADEAVRLVGQYLYGLAREYLCVICCDINYTPLCVGLINIGNENGVFFKLKDIMQVALLSNANNIIIMHNHPYRYETKQLNLTPSPSDIEFTDLTMKACELMGIALHDSIIIGDAYDEKQHLPAFYSIRENKTGLFHITKRNISDVTNGRSLQKVIDNQSKLDWDNKNGKLADYWNKYETEDMHQINICFSQKELIDLLKNDTVPNAFKEKIDEKVSKTVESSKYQDNLKNISLVKDLAIITDDINQFDTIVSYASTPKFALLIDELIMMRFTPKEIIKELSRFDEKNIDKELLGNGKFKRR